MRHKSKHWHTRCIQSNSKWFLDAFADEHLDHMDISYSIIILAAMRTNEYLQGLLVLRLLVLRHIECDSGRPSQRLLKGNYEVKRYDDEHIDVRGCTHFHSLCMLLPQPTQAVRVLRERRPARYRIERYRRHARSTFAEHAHSLRRLR